MRKKLIFYCFISCFVVLSPFVRSQETRYAGAFLELGIGARGIGMGEAFVSIVDDGSAFYWNPAGASTVLRAEVSGMYAALFKGLANHYYLGFTRPLSGSSAISINWVRLSVPKIPQYDSALLNDPNSSYDTRVAEAGEDPNGFWNQFALTDQPLSFSNSNDDALFVTLAKEIKWDLDFGWQYFVIPITIPLGVNVKLIRQSVFENKGSGIGFDLGGMFKFGLDDLLNDNRLGKFSFGLAVKDIWKTKITWNTDSRHSDSIDRSWHFGMSYMQPLPSMSGQLLLGYSYVDQITTHHNFGFEYLYFNRLAVRFGLKDGKFSAGVGLNVSRFRFDYAFRTHSLGGSHRINTALTL